MLSSQNVVDQLTSELAERRQVRFGRRAAYFALVCAILSDEPAQQSDLSLSFERESTVRPEAPRAA